MAPIDDDLEELNLYLAECREHLSTIEPDLLSIEQSGAQIDENLVNRVFRAAHSIKGGAGFFGLHKIQELGHKAENILDMIRSREIIPSPEVINILLFAFDQLRSMINNPHESNQADTFEAVTALSELVASYLPSSQKTSLTQKVELMPLSGGSAISVAQFDLARAEKRDEYVYLVEVDLLHDVQRRGKTPWEVYQEYASGGTILECDLNFAAVGTLDDEACNRIPFEILFSSIIDPSFIGMLFEGLPKEQIRLISSPKNPQPMLRKDSPAEPAPVEAAPVKQAEPQAASAKRPSPAVSSAPVVGSETTDNSVDETLRVNVKLLENLMNLAGELVLSRNQMQEAIRRGNRHDMLASGQRVSLVTSELQETIMLTRMQPVGNIFNKFPRVVRDLARELKKEVQLELLGKDVELDKTIIEGLSEPLTHMVRNALDHGIESREARISSGKNPSGKLVISAYHAAGQVIVEVSDDGQGIDPEKIAASAVKHGQISAEQARLMSDKEKRALIFLPGLSTAEKVSDISGRGVGMDVVKTNLDRLGGKIDIDSEPGQGTTFRINLPLTLAIIPSLLVSVAQERFAIPQINISELVHIPAAQVKNRIEVVGDAEVLFLRGKLIPILRLADLLDIQEEYQDPDTGEVAANRRRRTSDRRSKHSETEENRGAGESSSAQDVEQAQNENRRRQNDRRYHASSDIQIAVISTGPLEYGLIVEQLHDTVEIVVRPLGRHLKHCSEYGGATILGDGCVALILDVSGLAAKANIISLAGSARMRQLAQENDLENSSGAQSLLLFRNTPTEHCAIPLDIVTRVERIDPQQVEFLGGKRTIQYRGATLPIIALMDAASVGDVMSNRELAVIVFQTGEREMGILAGMPVDAVETAALIDRTTLRQTAIAGSAIIHDHTTLLVDLDELVTATGWQDHAEIEAQTASTDGPTILLAEDSDFFRRQVCKYLEGAGFNVLLAEDGQAAWETLHASQEKVRLVVTDIEMPRLNGLELTRRIRGAPSSPICP